MIVWMRRHAHQLAGQLRASAGRPGRDRCGHSWQWRSSRCIREGFETAVFLLAAFQASESPTGPRASARSRGRRRCDRMGHLPRGGATRPGSLLPRHGGRAGARGGRARRDAIHTASETGWMDAWQAEALDLSWLVQPGTVGELPRDRACSVCGPAHGRRGRRLARLRGADAAVRALAARRDAAGPRGRAGRAATPPAVTQKEQPDAPHSRSCAAGSGRRGRPGRARRRPLGLRLGQLVGRGGAAAGRDGRVKLPTRAVAGEGERSRRGGHLHGGTRARRGHRVRVKDSKGIIVGERENVVPGSPARSRSHAPGRYMLNCPTATGSQGAS